MPAADPTDPEATEASESLDRLTDLIESSLLDRPELVRAIEHLIRLIVLGNMRQRILGRVQRLPADDLPVLDQLTAHLTQQRGDDPPEEAS